MWTTILPMVLWTTFALSLLAKMALNVHIYHYGFYLPMPATLVLVICLLYWIPKVLSGASGCGIVFRSLAMAVLVVAIYLSSQLVTKVLSIEGLRRWPRCRYNHHLWTQGTSSWVSHRFDPGVDRRKDFSSCNICRAARGDHAQLSIAENDNSALRKFHDTRNDRLWRDANA